MMRRDGVRLWTALWIVYLAWGSTYVAIKIAVRTLPPLLTAGNAVPRGGRDPRRHRRGCATLAPGGAPPGAPCGGSRGCAARIRRRPRARRRDAHRLRRRRDDRRLRAPADRRLAARRRRARAAADGARRRRRVGRARHRRRPRELLGRRDRRRAPRDAHRLDLLVERVVRVAVAPAAEGPARRHGLRDARRRGRAHRGSRRHRRARRPRCGRVRARTDRSMGLPRDRRVGARVHGLRLAPRQRADLAGRDAPVRQPTRRRRARRAAPRRAPRARRPSSAQR